VGELILQPRHGRDRIPAPDDRAAPFFPASTSAVAIARVPASNGGVSKTPIGPFQKIVLARSRRARKSCCVASSMSKTAQPWDRVSRYGAMLARALERRRNQRAAGQDQFFAAGRKQLLRKRNAIRLD